LRGGDAREYELVTETRPTRNPFFTGIPFVIIAGSSPNHVCDVSDLGDVRALCSCHRGNGCTSAAGSPPTESERRPTENEPKTGGGRDVPEDSRTLCPYWRRESRSGEREGRRVRPEQRQRQP
jgi:hypothetical protein